MRKPLQTQGFEVELRGLEPLTPTLPAGCSTFNSPLSAGLRQLDSLVLLGILSIRVI
jgi:hypothetical protein